MLNNKGFFFLVVFFNTKYKRRIHILKTELRSRYAVLGTLSIKAKQGFVIFFFFFLCRYIQRLEYVKLISTKDHHTILPMNVASINSRTWSTVMFTSTP